MNKFKVINLSEQLHFYFVDFIKAFDFHFFFKNFIVIFSFFNFYFDEFQGCNRFSFLCLCVKRDMSWRPKSAHLADGASSS